MKHITKTLLKERNPYTIRITTILCVMALVLTTLTSCGGKETNNAEAALSSLINEFSPKPTAPSPAAPPVTAESNAAEEAEVMEAEMAPEAPEAEMAPEAPEAGMPESGYDKSLANIRMRDSLLFERDGVRFVFDGIRVVDEGLMVAYFDFTLENNHPDNKIATVEMQSISFNELEPEGIMYIFDPLGEWSRVEAGETRSVSTQNGYETGRYDHSILSALGVSPEEFPIETIGFAFKVQIGSDSEEEWHYVTLETADYNGKSYRKYFGDPVASFDGTYITTGEAYTLDIYARLDDLGTTVILLPAEGSEKHFQPLMTVNLGANGKQMSNAMNDQTYQNTTLAYQQIFYPTGGTILRCAKTEDELRKSMEIGPNEPLEIQLLGPSFEGGALTLLTK